jgi:hypothetical protein
MIAAGQGCDKLYGCWVPGLYTGYYRGASYRRVEIAGQENRRVGPPNDLELGKPAHTAACTNTGTHKIDDDGQDRTDEEPSKQDLIIG